MRLPLCSKRSLETQSDRVKAEAVDQQFGVWQGSLRDYAQREEEKGRAEQAMTAAAGIAVEQCTKLRSDQKARLAAAQKTDAQCRAECQGKADMVDRLIRLSLAARLAEQRYMHSKDPAALEENRAGMKEIYNLCPKLKERFQTDADRRQTDELVQAGQAYQKAFEHWAFIQMDIEKAQGVIATAAQKGQDECDALAESCKKKVAGMLAKGLDKLDTKAFAGETAVADGANRLAMLMNESRVGEMRYLLTTDNRHLIAQQERFEKAGALARDLKSRMTDKTNSARADAVITAMQNYDDSMIKYVTGFKSQRDDAKTMAAKAASFVAQCEKIRDDQRRNCARPCCSPRSCWPNTWRRRKRPKPRSRLSWRPRVRSPFLAGSCSA